MKNLILIILILKFTNSNCQNNLKLVSFEVYESNIPLPGVNISIINNEQNIETQTDYNGYAEFNLSNINVEIKLFFLGPYYIINLIENVDFIKIDINKKIALFYNKDKVIKRIKLKPKGF
jgi:hypothetical protein